MVTSSRLFIAKTPLILLLTSGKGILTTILSPVEIYSLNFKYNFFTGSYVGFN